MDLGRVFDAAVTICLLAKLLDVRERLCVKGKLRIWTKCYGSKNSVDANEELFVRCVIGRKGMENDKNHEFASKVDQEADILKPYKNSILNHMFAFRQFRPGRETLTAFPATVNLASHFASGTYGTAGSGVKELQKEGVRLASFENFPTTVPVSAMRMAQAGFHYTGTRDKVECFLCKATYQGWKMGDKPAAIHARISPNCPLVVGSETTNLPLPRPVTSAPDFSQPASDDSGFTSGSSAPDFPQPVSDDSGFASGSSAQGGSMAGPNSVSHKDHLSARDELQTDSVPLVVPESGPAGLGHLTLSRLPSGIITQPSTLTHTSVPATATAQVTHPAGHGNLPFRPPPQIGIPPSPLPHASVPATDSRAQVTHPLPTRRLDLGGAVYPLYSQMDARKRSFATWTQGDFLPPVDELITLGFFYAGYADCVRCFFCGIGLKSWEPGDIPAEVHGRWRPTCEYLRLVKGDHFVDQVANGGRNVSEQNASSNTVSNSATQSGTNPANQLPPELPNTPIVHRARETGYTDQQIVEGMQQLRLIGMESEMDVMLVEVLTNLFRDHPPPPGNNGNGNNNNNNNNNSNSSNNSNNGNNSNNRNSPNNAALNNTARDNSANRADLEHQVDSDAESEDDPGVAGGSEGINSRQERLQQENARLRNMRTCQRCQTRPVGVIFLPCGHILACTTCAPTIRRCLRCETVIKATANVYFS